MPKQELELSPEWVEVEIALSARHGDEELRAFIIDATQKLGEKRTRLERLFPGRPTGNNFVISQLNLVLAKIGHADVT